MGADFLFIASDYKPKPGGIAAYLDCLARGLRELGNDVRVIAVVPRDERDRIEFLEHYEEWVTPFPIVHDWRPSGWLGSRLVSALEIARCVAAPPIRRILERARYFDDSREAVTRLRDVVRRMQPKTVVFGHLDMKLYPLALFLSEHRVPYGIVAHDSEVYRSAKHINDLVRRGIVLRNAAWLTANSRHTQSLLEQWNLPRHKIMIVHPPIAASALREGSRPSAEGGDRFSLITIARLVRSKGIDIVLRALPLLEAAGIRYRYAIVGDGAERSRLESLAEELGVKASVEFTGLISEEKKWALLRAANVFVMPSRVDPAVQHEGFGLAFIEAAAFGVPGVGSTGGGIPEAVLAGQTGILVAENSPDKLAEALVFLHRHPDVRREMGKVGRTRAHEFAPHVIARRFQDEVSRRLSEETLAARRTPLLK